MESSLCASLTTLPVFASPFLQSYVLHGQALVLSTSHGMAGSTNRCFLKERQAFSFLSCALLSNFSPATLHRAYRSSGCDVVLLQDALYQTKCRTIMHKIFQSRLARCRHSHRFVTHRVGHMKRYAATRRCSRNQIGRRS